MAVNGQAAMDSATARGTVMVGASRVPPMVEVPAAMDSDLIASLVGRSPIGVRGEGRMKCEVARVDLEAWLVDQCADPISAHERSAPVTAATVPVVMVVTAPTAKAACPMSWLAWNKSSAASTPLSARSATSAANRRRDDAAAVSQTLVRACQPGTPSQQGPGGVPRWTSPGSFS